MELFKQEDFKVFGIPEFNERMAAIRARIRPKLTSIGEELAPKLSGLVDCPLYVHVAKHARRILRIRDGLIASDERTTSRGSPETSHAGEAPATR